MRHEFVEGHELLQADMVVVSVAQSRSNFLDSGLVLSLLVTGDARKHGGQETEHANFTTFIGLVSVELIVSQLVLDVLRQCLELLILEVFFVFEDSFTQPLVGGFPLFVSG